MPLGQGGGGMPSDSALGRQMSKSEVNLVYTVNSRAAALLSETLSQNTNTRTAS